MATILVDGITVGPAPLPGPPTANPILPGANFEFRPQAGTLPSGESGPNTNYISTYQPFSMTVSAIPTAPLEVITSVVILGPTSCIIEDPLPGSDTTKSLNKKLEIPVSPFWLPGLFLEPLVVSTPGLPATISGYFTERNWYDRVITVSYLNAIAKFTSLGLFYAPLENFPTNLPFDLNAIKIALPSTVNINTFYPLTVGAAFKTESELLEPYLSTIGQVISYKGTDIKKLRFYFNITVNSSLGVYPFTAYMIVQYNQKAANERLKLLLRRRRRFAFLNIPDPEE